LLCHDIAAALVHLHSQGGVKQASGGGFATCMLVCALHWRVVQGVFVPFRCMGGVVIDRKVHALSVAEAPTLRQVSPVHCVSTHALPRHSLNPCAVYAMLLASCCLQV
jgi:hypothetical protein